jgi:hypothetical protein
MKKEGYLAESLFVLALVAALAGLALLSGQGGASRPARGYPRTGLERTGIHGLAAVTASPSTRRATLGPAEAAPALLES